MTASSIRSNLAQLPFLRAERDPHGTCIADDTGTLDNAAFADVVRRLADRFASLGVVPGDTVAVMLPNCSEIITTMFAAWVRGAALTPINPTLTDTEIRYQLEDSNTKVVVGEERAAGLARSVGARWVDVNLVHEGTEEASPEAAPVASMSDFALVIYTSGTTGKPKGVLLDHANLDAMSASVVEAFTLSSADTSLLILPLFHVNGLVVSVLSVLRAGGDVVVAPRFSAGTFWDLVETHRPTFFSAVPTIYAVLDAQTERQVDTSSLRFVVCGAAPMPPDLITRFEERFKVPVVEGYGLSEGSVASTINPVDGPRKPGTVGPALPGQEVEVVSSDGVPQPQGERGRS
jgi:acyl-CoA synthetase (AMP-forming)/AMP-acid ligase II